MRGPEATVSAPGPAPDPDTAHALPAESQERHRREVRWIPRISEIDPSDWEAVFGTAPTRSYAFHRAVEEAGLAGIQMHYLVLRAGGEVRAILPCFTYSIELDILADGNFRVLLAKVKRRFPKLLTQRIFFAGTPVALCDHLWGIPADGSDGERAGLEQAAISAIKGKSRLERCVITILKEIPAAQKKRFAAGLGREFFLAESLPNTFLVTGDPEQPYFQGFRKKYRMRANASRKRFLEAGMTWELQRDFAPWADQFEKLYLQVLERSRTRFERLNADFFRKVAERLGDSAYCLVGRNRAGEIVCFELILDEGDAMVPMYLGIDYSQKDAGEVYFNCIFRIIEEAEKRGKRLVKLGQTSYEAKAYAGAVFERLYLAIDSPHRWLRFVLKVLSPALFPKACLPRTRCFRDEVVPGIESVLAARGIVHEPLKTTEEEA